jgi:cytoskeletal protein RodZ
METVPLRFNSHLGGGFFKNYWWIILIIVVIILAIGSFFALSGKSNTNTNKVSLQKKIVDGEEVYIKIVNGEEVPVTAQDKIQISTADNTAKNAIASANNYANKALQEIQVTETQAIDTQELAQQAVTQAMEASKLASDLAIPSE